MKLTDNLSPERAMLRLEQLGREERRAVRLGDVESLCRIAPLIALTVAAIDEEAVSRYPRGRAVIASARIAHAAAEEMLVQRMVEIRRELDVRKAARRTAAGYAGRRAATVRLTRGT